MKHSDPTNLLKGFLTQAVLSALLCLALPACNNKTETAALCPLLGKWAITGIETRQSRQLDPDAAKIYQQELDKMLDGAFLLMAPDSTYELRLGNEHEKGNWKWDPTDSLVRLQSQDPKSKTLPGGHNTKKRYYTVQPNGRQSFKLKQELDSQGKTLFIRFLPH